MVDPTLAKMPPFSNMFIGTSVGFGKLVTGKLNPISHMGGQILPPPRKIAYCAHIGAQMTPETY